MRDIFDDEDAPPAEKRKHVPAEETLKHPLWATVGRFFRVAQKS